MFDSDFKAAEEYLTFAFERCHKESRGNKRLILIYLLPVKMLLGYMPKVIVLKRYDLMQFADVAKAVSSGNLLLLNEALQRNEAFFIKCGIYLILEKLKIITYRNLFKKVYLIIKSHQLPIESFTTVLKMMQVEDIDNDETECILANLIYENKVKGYISHQHQKLVVSKQNPFPVLSSVLWTVLQVYNKNWRRTEIQACIFDTCKICNIHFWVNAAITGWKQKYNILQKFEFENFSRCKQCNM